MVGTSWPIAFIVWWLLWQWKAQSPSSSARNSTCRICPTATSAVTSCQRVDFGVGPPSVPVITNSCPCRCIGGVVIVRLAMRGVHEGAGPARDELVDEGLARADGRLRQARHAVHAVGQALAVPVDG